MLTLVFTPSMLAIRVWASAGAYGFINRFRAISFGRVGRDARSDLRLSRAARNQKSPLIIWTDDDEPETNVVPAAAPLRAAE